MAEPNSDKRDIFISYSSKDRPFAERLAADLSDLGLRVWIDTLEMKVGDSLGRKIEGGILGSGWLAVVLSPNAVESAWVEKELNAALAFELEKKEIFVLPILHRDCTIPLFLRDKVYADFRVDYQAGREALLKRLKPPLDATLLDLLMSGRQTEVLSAHASLRAEERYAYMAQLCRNLDSKSVGTVYRAAKSGVLPCFRISSCIRFDPRAVARALRERVRDENLLQRRSDRSAQTNL